MNNRQLLELFIHVEVPSVLTNISLENPDLFQSYFSLFGGDDRGRSAAKYTTRVLIEFGKSYVEAKLQADTEAGKPYSAFDSNELNSVMSEFIVEFVQNKVEKGGRIEVAEDIEG